MVVWWRHMAKKIWVNTGLGKGLLPARHKVITWTNVDLSSKGLCGNPWEQFLKTNVILTHQLSINTNFQEVDQHAEGKWLIHGAKHHKDNQLQSSHVELPSWEYDYDIKSEKYT